MTQILRLRVRILTAPAIMTLIGELRPGKSASFHNRVLVLLVHNPARVVELRARSAKGAIEVRQGGHMMKRLAVTGAVLGLVLLLGHGNALAGNGVGSLAKNKVYSVQIIAHDPCPAGSFDDTSRRTIAVLAGFEDTITDGTLLMNIDKTNKIFLAPGTDASVTDGNACDGDGAAMILPSDVSTTWQVYVRLVGKPDSKIDVSTCAVDTTGELTGTANTVLCSTDHFVKTRYTGKGEPSFTNATSQLLFISNPLLCDSGKCPLFQADYLNYFWDWNTPLGRPHAQLWFVPVQ